MIRKYLSEFSHMRPFLVLGALPLLLLLFNDAWSWDSTEFFDNHVYVGFFRHYLEFTYPFTENYKSSRLPFLLPGVFLYRVLPDAVAHHAIFFLFLLSETALLFVWNRRRFGSHAGFVVAAAHSTFTYCHTGPSYHNQAATAYFVLALVLLDLPERWSSIKRIAVAGGVFAMSMTTDTIIAALTPVFGLYALHAVPRPWTLRKVSRHTGYAVLGAMGAIVLLGLINVILGGPFLFFADQIRASMYLAKSKSLSALTLLDFLKVWEFPWLTLPATVALGSMISLAIRIRRWQFDHHALAALCFLLAMAGAALLHARGLGILEFPHLFHPFFAPMFLALGALLGHVNNDNETTEKPPLSGLFLAGAAISAIVPLSLLGSWLSRFFYTIGRSTPILANGSLVAFSIVILAVLVSIVLRRSVRASSLVAIGAFGLVNAVNAPPWQPAYLYAVQDHCSFRRDFYSALIEADDIFHKFDRNGRAWWAHPVVPVSRPRFDGKGWCKLLPIESTARAALLSKYFFTTAQFENDGEMTGPLSKLAIAAPTAKHADGVLASFRARNGKDKRFTEVFTHVIKRPTFSLTLRGYEITAPDGHLD